VLWCCSPHSACHRVIGILLGASNIYYRPYEEFPACAQHIGDLCFISTVDGHHHRVDPEHVSLWAKEIVSLFCLCTYCSILTMFESAGNATSNRPLENITFQDYFLPGAKRARNTQSQSSTNPCAPTIHVTVNTGPSGGNKVTASPPRRSPLGTITAASVNVDNANTPTSLYRSHSLVAKTPALMPSVTRPSLKSFSPSTNPGSSRTRPSSRSLLSSSQILCRSLTSILLIRLSF
jgi:hypothetical protein